MTARAGAWQLDWPIAPRVNSSTPLPRRVARPLLYPPAFAMRAASSTESLTGCILAALAGLAAVTVTALLFC